MRHSSISRKWPHFQTEGGSGKCTSVVCYSHCTFWSQHIILLHLYSYKSAPSGRGRDEHGLRKTQMTDVEVCFFFIIYTELHFIHGLTSELIRVSAKNRNHKRRGLVGNEQAQYWLSSQPGCVRFIVGTLGSKKSWNGSSDAAIIQLQSHLLCDSSSSFFSSTFVFSYKSFESSPLPSEEFPPRCLSLLQYLMFLWAVQLQ